MKHVYTIHLELLKLLVELIKRLLADLDAGSKPAWLHPKAIIFT